MSYNLITILGPTATGKTKLAAKLANKFNAEIISADSRQVYKKLNIGTGKDYDDYIVDGKSTPYHLIDIIEPSDEYNLFLFQQDFIKIFSLVVENKKIPMLVGGTGMYLSSVLQKYKLAKTIDDKNEREFLNSLPLNELQNILKGLNSKLHNSTDLNDKQRTIQAILVAKANSNKVSNFNKEINSLTLGINLPREEIKQKITNRLKLRLENGMIEEVKELLTSGITPQKLDYFGLEYRYISKYLLNEITYNEMFYKLNISIHQFAKRQITWFRKMEREGIKIFWLDGPNFEQAQEIIAKNFYAVPD